MNYILHIEHIHFLFREDKRLTPHHISLYYALFHQWNAAKFTEELSICRSEIMTASRIGSVNTYLKCLKQLHEYGYLTYRPSKNPLIGSRINMSKFDKCADNVKNKKGAKSYNSDDTSDEQVMRPYVNNKKTIKPFKPEKEENVDKRISFCPPSVDEIGQYFKENKSNITEAIKFHNYFESNGWLVGGRTKMQNWQAAARNWMLNALKWNSPENPKANHLSTSTNKNYNIPL